MRAVALLARAAEHCDDATRLRRIVPYLVVRGKLLNGRTLRSLLLRGLGERLRMGVRALLNRRICCSATARAPGLLGP